MARNANYHVKFRRRREGHTNYHRRRSLIQSGKPRLVVRRSNKHERVLIAKAKIEGDEVIVAASSQHLKDYGWKGATGNLPASYLTGYLAGKYAEAMKVKEAILDLGINSCRKSTRVSAMLAGAVAAGLEIPHNEEVFPPEDRYTGKHIADFAKSLKKENPEQYTKQFGAYKKYGGKPESLPTYFKATIKAIDAELASGEMKDKLKARNKKNTTAKKAKKKTTAKKKTRTATKKMSKAAKKKSSTTTKKKTSTAAKKKSSTTTKKKTSTAAKKKSSTTKKSTASKSSSGSKKTSSGTKKTKK